MRCQAIGTKAGGCASTVTAGAVPGCAQWYALTGWNAGAGPIGTRAGGWACGLFRRAVPGWAH
jgi:hypothetical protein